MTIARDYGVLIEEEGIALRGLFIIDPKGVLRQVTVNDLPVGRSVEETVRRQFLSKDVPIIIISMIMYVFFFKEKN